MFILEHVREKAVLAVFLGAFICLTVVTLIIFHTRDVLAERGTSAGTLRFGVVPQPISKGDHTFLDDLFQQQNQNNQRQTNPISTPSQNVAKAEMDLNPAPRAELIVNTSEVKRAQLVVNSRMIKRAEVVHSPK
jgi:hypothetical protein